MDTAIVGPGRVGTTLAVALARAGHRVTHVVAREAVPTAFSDRVPDATAVAVEDIPDTVDLVIISTGDDAIGEVVAAAAVAGSVVAGQRWVHTAGGRSVDVLSPLAALGARTAACHPAMTFPDPDAGLANLPGTSWAVTAAAEDLGWARVLVTDLRGSPVTVRAADRTLYHAGLSVGSNGTTAVVTLARDLLLGAGIEDPGAFLGPLTTASADGGSSRGVDALTGPVRRGDVGTVRAHLDELRRSFPEVVDTYVVLADLMLAHAGRAGLEPQKIEAIRAALGVD